MNTPSVIYRQDYQAYPFNIKSVNLTFELDSERTYVYNTMHICRKQEFSNVSTLILDGEELELISLKINGRSLIENEYRLNPVTLHIREFPREGILEIISCCRPKTNSALMGLYISKGIFLTQCEPQGFRRITWFADRPDVTSKYSVRIRGKVNDFPIMLSNGNLIEKKYLLDGRQEFYWEDPFPKPCYLFALVAGKLIFREKILETNSGREVSLRVYSDPGLEEKTVWALDSLIRAIQWDENRYGLELDLDRFMIVAVHDFNMGAMENKGLNIFNSAYILAKADTATDSDYEDIEAVVGHEYFHNWTGNRVTCRDWFQLSLKEGLTVFREQQFSADMAIRGLSNLSTTSVASVRAVKRIDNVLNLLSDQFLEDSGPMAHPVQPDSYVEISNFYTSTIYEKGAELVRMQHTLLGEDGFRTGLRDYLTKYDGQSATCDDFIDVMESIYIQLNPNKDFSSFRNWYKQAGTPKVTVKLYFDPLKKRCIFSLSQICPLVGIEKENSNQEHKEPFFIPFSMGLLDNNGKTIPLIINGESPRETVLLELIKPNQEWIFEEVPIRPIPSLLRDFSAPVSIYYPYTNQELTILSLHDGNLFSRWTAFQSLASRQILGILKNKEKELNWIGVFICTWDKILQDKSLDSSYLSRILSLPDEKILSRHLDLRLIDPASLSDSIEVLHSKIGHALSKTLQIFFKKEITKDSSYTPYLSGKRALKNLILRYLAAGNKSIGEEFAKEQYEKSKNMTDQISSLAILVNYCDEDIFSCALEKFYNQWKDDPLVIDKWFAIQARGRNTDASIVRELLKHPAFDICNPNRVRSLIFQFSMNNPRGFHQKDGSGYQFLAEQILNLDSINPELSARLARLFDNWAQLIDELRVPMKEVLMYMIQKKSILSKNVFEIISKALKYAE